MLFLVAMSLLGVEPALYSILTYVAAARTLDFVVYGIEEYTAITIVSARSGEIARADHRRLGRGVTVYKGDGGLSGDEQEILYCVVTRLEIGKVKRSSSDSMRAPSSRHTRSAASTGAWSSAASSTEQQVHGSGDAEADEPRVVVHRPQRGNDQSAPRRGAPGQPSRGWRAEFHPPIACRREIQVFERELRFRTIQ